jgi:tRNA nucleotidyltransferase/poly(A) polymerase
MDGSPQLQFETENPEYLLAARICETLQKSGFTAWLAGGCVRDAILGVTPADFDVATNATPDQIEEIFPKTVAVGKAFGVIVVVEGKNQVEVATFRMDGEYKDGRRPQSIQLSTPEEDARRRDFTVNALFYDLKNGEIHDFAGGREDIEKKIIRAVGVPEQRFAEDHLRILRAVRFVSQLGMTLEPGTAQAVFAHVGWIKDVSGERIFDELSKLLKGKNRIEALQLLLEKDFLKTLFPDFFAEKTPALVSAEAYFQKWQTNLDVSQELVLWFSFLLWLQTVLRSPWTPEQLEKIAGDLRFSKELKQNIKAGFQWYGKKDLFSGSVSMGELLEYSFEPGPSLGLRAHEIFALTDEHRQILSQTLKRYHELFSLHRLEHPVGMPKSLVAAADFADGKAGRIIQGPELGLALKKCYQWQLENPRWNAEQIIEFWKQHG